jgi:hypothetical protein
VDSLHLTIYSFDEYGNPNTDSNILSWSSSCSLSRL